MFYQLFVAGDTSIDINPPDQPTTNFALLEEFESAGGGILAVESPVNNPNTVTEANIFDVGLYLGSLRDGISNAGEIRWASDNLVHSLYPSFGGITDVPIPSIDETFQSFDPATRTLSIELDFASADQSDQDQFIKATNDPGSSEVLGGFVEIEFSSDFRSVTGFALFDGFDVADSSIARWQAGFAGRLFDGLEYIASNPDLIGALGADRDAGLAHFVQSGRSEGRFTFFDGLEYIASHSDLTLAFGANRDLGTEHYIRAGFAEGRSADEFDAEQYLLNYPDLQAAFGANEAAATQHYVTAGFFENRTDDFLM